VRFAAACKTYSRNWMRNDRNMSKLRPRKAAKARLATVLEAIPNVGASIARDLRSIGIKRPQELIGRNPHSLYQALCDRTRARQDPCVLDTFISAVRFMEGAPSRPWWYYTAERKQKFPASSLGPRANATVRGRK
jgi:pathogenicity locus Cdd1 protein